MPVGVQARRFPEPDPGGDDQASVRKVRSSSGTGSSARHSQARPTEKTFACSVSEVLASSDLGDEAKDVRPQPGNPGSRDPE